MASGTVGYTDTRGNKDFSGIIASQIGKRLKEASDMAADERGFAAKKAEDGGTSLEEAGIGKGYFFKRALGNRFGGDRIARTKGRMGMGGAANNPAANYKQRFRGGFDYNVTNQIQNSADTVPLTNAVVSGLRGVESGLVNISRAIQRQDGTLSDLAKSQADMAKATMFNGYLFAMFQQQQRRRDGRASARSEERSIERRFREGGVSIGGQSFGGAGGNRGMNNVTPRGGFGGGGGLLETVDKAQNITSVATNPTSGKVVKGIKSGASSLKSGVKLASNKAVTSIVSAPKIAKVLANKAITNGIAAVGERATPQLILASKKLAGTGKNLKQVRSLAGSMIGSKNMLRTLARPGLGLLSAEDAKLAAMSLEDMEKLTDAKALGAMLGGDMAETAVNMRAYGLGNLNNVDDVTKTYLELIEGTSPYDFGTKYSKQQADKLLEGVMGGPKYRKWIKNSKIPFDKAAKSTFTHKMLKAPGIPKGLASGTSKGVGKITSKAAAKSLWKKIPVIAGIAGIVFGIQRALEGDLLGAGMEITSGILGATGKGAPVSFAIDSALLARDLGAMPMRTGGTIYPNRTNSMLNVGGRMFNFNEPGNKEVVRVEKDNDNRFVEMGTGIVEGFKKKRSEYVALQATGVENALGSLKGSGFFSGLFSSVKDVGNTVKNLNPVKGVFDGFLQWFNKGAKPGENNMKWFGKNSLLSDDWKQRGKFGKGGKYGGWDITRGFRPGVSAEEGGMMSGPTPAVRQAVKRSFGFLSSFRGGGLATLASLVANEFINPQPLADGTMDGYMNSIGENNSMKLQNTDSNAGVAATVINNNYYNSGGTSGGQESGNETLGQSFNGDLEKFITGYSIMSK